MVLTITETLFTFNEVYCKINESNHQIILEAKAFDPDGRMRYLMQRQIPVDPEADPPLLSSTPKKHR